MKHQFLTKKTTRSKYNAKKCEIDGFKFDSLAEGKYYVVLRDRLKKQEIGELQIHPFFTIFIKGDKIGKVVLDFSYYDKKLEKYIYVDVKGVDTAISKWKRKCVEADFGIKVEVVK